MAESSDVSASPSTKPANKLDSKSKEELIILVKKQLLQSQKLKQQITDLNGKVTELSNSGKDCEKCHDLNSNLQTYKAENSRLNEMIECTKMKEEGMKSTFECLNKEINELKLKFKNAEAENDVLKSARDDAISACKMVKDSLKSEMEELKQENNRLNLNLQNIDKNTDIIENFEAECEENRKTIESLTKEKNSFMESLKIRENEARENDEKHLNEILQLQKQIKIIESEREEFKSKLAESNSPESQPELEKIKQDKILLAKELQRVRNQLYEWEKLLELERFDKDRAYEELLDLERKEDESFHQLDDLNSALQEALQERDNLRENLLKLREQHESDSTIDLQCQVGTLKNELDKFQNKVGQLSKELEKREIAYVKIKDELQNSERQNDEMKEIVKVVKNQQYSLIQQNKHLHDELRNLNDSHQSRISELIEKYNIMKSQYSENTDRNSCQLNMELTGQLTKINSISRELKSALEDKATELTDLKQTLIILQTEMKRLEEENIQLKSFPEQTEQMKIKSIYESDEEKIDLSAELNALNEALSQIKTESLDLKVEVEKLQDENNKQKEMLTVELKKVKDQYESFKESTGNEFESTKLAHERTIQELEQTKNQIQNLQSTKEECVSQIAAKDELLQNIKAQYEDVLAEYTSLKNSTDISTGDSKSINFQEEIESLKKEIISLHESLQVKDHDCKKIKEDYDNLKAKKDTNLIEAEDAMISHLKKQLIECGAQTELEFILGKEESSEDNRENVDILLQEKELEIIKYKTTIDECEKLIENLESKIEESKQKETCTIEQLESLKNSNSQQRECLENMTTVINELDISLKDRQSEVAILNEKLSELNVRMVEKESLQNALKALSQETEELKCKLKISEEMLVKSSNNNEKLVAQITDLENKNYDKTISDLAAQLKEIEEKFTEESQANHHLKEDLNRQRESQEEKTANIKEYLAKIDNLEQLNKSLEEQINQFKAKEYEKNNEELYNKLNNTNVQLTAALKNNELLKEEISFFTEKEYEKSIEKLNQDLKEANQDLIASNKNNDLLKEQIDQLENLLGSKKELASQEIISLINENSDLRASLEKLRADVDSLRIENESISEKLSKSKAEGKENVDKCFKFKQIALKSKKECNEIKIKVESLENDKENAVSQLESLNQTFSQLKKEKESLEIIGKELNNEIEDLKDLNLKLKNENKDIINSLSSSTADREKADSEINSLKDVISNLEKGCNEAKELKSNISKMKNDNDEMKFKLENSEREKEKVNNEVITLKGQLSSMEKEKNELQKTREDYANEIVSLKKVASKNSMLDLEFADYERTIETLNKSIEEKVKENENLQAEVERRESLVESLKKEIESSESQTKSAEDRMLKLKQLLKKIKKELTDSRQSEMNLKKREAELQIDVERLVSQNEKSKLDLSNSLSAKQKIEDRLEKSNEQLQKTIKSLESRMRHLNEDLELSKNELETVQSEYESYKVKVKSVLTRQSKPDTAFQTKMEELKEEKSNLESNVENLRAKVRELKEQIMTVQSESEHLEDENRRIMQRNNKLQRDLKTKETEFRERFEDLQQSKNEHFESVKQLTVQNENLSKTFKDQMKSVQDEHRKALCMLQQQLDNSHSENKQIQTELHKVRNLLADGSQITVKEQITDILNDPRQVERPSAEGMEYKEIERKEKRNFSSFEQLLNSPIDSRPPSEIFEYEDEGILKTKLTTSQKKVEHLSELLNESEATSARLSEQTRFLKEEIRRLERNQERENSVSNMEYLKNIIFKFVTIKNGDERQQLVPVLHTMLKLSVDEKNLLNKVASGSETESKAAADTAWSGYFHRWTGYS
ncbi:DgyrCDS8016 [Dimorphilus gyrociliatus]|uniref:DgyrCDS8016 n=1 Tax=Dimorphilus gyrociliatus TaxID=2664684 RepID=A0A7I8VUK8_9ANNE|nr:DgyrCDS8016 [Dimorphilus gyrociliatus]